MQVPDLSNVHDGRSSFLTRHTRLLWARGIQARNPFPSCQSTLSMNTSQRLVLSMVFPLQLHVSDHCPVTNPCHLSSNDTTGSMVEPAKAVLDALSTTSCIHVSRSRYVRPIQIGQLASPRGTSFRPHSAANEPTSMVV